MIGALEKLHLGSKDKIREALSSFFTNRSQKVNSAASGKTVLNQLGQRLSIDRVLDDHDFERHLIA
jgi:hypothetical protein